MAYRTPYLEAVQAIHGNTPGEKHKTIKLIAKHIADNVQSVGDSVCVPESISLPKALEPLVCVEVAKLLKRHDGVVTALKCDDYIVVNRAFQAYWFFNGSNKDVTNFAFFEKQLLPYVSLGTRFKLVRSLAKYLRQNESELAEQFFTGFAEMYGVDQAVPLLAACSESFAYSAFVDHKIVLSQRAVLILFRRNPNLVIRYLMLTKRSTDTEVRNILRIDIWRYSSFLPKLVRKHFEAFTELFEAHGRLPIKLGKRCAEMFLKNGTDKLLEKPCLYLPILPLKLVTAKLTEIQFKTMFRNLFPPEIEDFSFDDVLNFLKYYPEDAKLSLITNTFKEVYGENLLDRREKITPMVLRMLPPEERAKQAKIKLEADSDWHISKMSGGQTSWRCYLPVSESIPAMKDQINRCSAFTDRAEMLHQMIFTCEINDDKDALLEVLRYFVQRHKNEVIWLKFNFYNNLLAHFDLWNLGSEIWEILNDIIRKMYIDDTMSFRTSVTERLLEEAIHYDVDHGLSIGDRTRMYVELEVKSRQQKWNILVKYPEYEKTCLETFLTTVPERYPEGDKLWEENEVATILGLVKAIYDFNERNAKANNKMEKLVMKSYPWLMGKVQSVIASCKEKQPHVLKRIGALLEKHEKDLYDAWIRDPSKEEICSIRSGEALNLLRKDPNKILEHWNEYLKKVRDEITCDKNAVRFVRNIRWYRDIPIKFARQCFEEVQEKKDSSALLVLAVLDGQSFTSIVEPFLPNKASLEKGDVEQASRDYRIGHSIPLCMNLANPPVSLDLVERFCQEELQEIVPYLFNICRRTSVAKVIPFATKLVDDRVSLMKHGIRLFYKAATIKELYQFLSDLWSNEKHRSIRQVVFGKIYDLFLKHPRSASWHLLGKTIVTLTFDADTEALESLSDLKKVPNEYVAEYVNLVLNTIDNLTAKDCKSGDLDRGLRGAGQLLRNIDAATGALFPEEFCEHLLKRYLFDVSLSPDLAAAGRHFAINVYIMSAREKLEARLKIFEEHFVRVISADWDKPHSKEFPYYYPTRSALHNFVVDLTRESEFKRIDSRIFDVMTKILSGRVSSAKVAGSYLLLVYAVELQASQSPKEFGAKVGRRLPDLAGIFSQESILFMADVLKGVRKPLHFGSIDANEMRMSVSEGLVEARNVPAALTAARMISSVDNLAKYGDRFCELTRTLSSHDHPGVISIINQVVNTMNYPSGLPRC